MKKLFFIVIIVLYSSPALARHIAGGELFYEYLGTSDNGGGNMYKVTLRLFRDCASSGPLLQNEKVTVGVYENNNLVIALPLAMIGSVSTITLNTSLFPCLVGNVRVCYEMAIYSNTVTLPVNIDGYTLSRTGCCRIDNISGLSQLTNVGSNYVTKIPGTATLPSGHNSSPAFNIKDTALVCAKRKFMLDFGAVDPDNDSLSYSFCDAYAASNNSNNAPPANFLTLIPLPYAFPFSGTYPLGPGVTIDPQTGIIQGIAPAEGQYVVSVCITEWRNGKSFSEHRKDFILKVQNCDIAEATLPEKIIKCDDNIVHFENQSASSGITSYLWNFGDPSSPATDNTPTPTHVYNDTGRYTASLTIKGPKGCEGTASTQVLVYPGFKPGFTITGSCYANPYQFTDTSVTRYGTVNSWLWRFDDKHPAGTDTSHRKNPQYKYQLPDTSNVSLVVTTSKGCIDTLHQQLVVVGNPALQLPFKDTLICSIDTLPVKVPGNGVFSWKPNTNILLGNTGNPLLFPKDTTRYVVTLNESGCISTDTVTVNVLRYITVQLRPDTTICKTDTFTLHPVSHALSYQWTPAYALSNSTVKYPQASPAVNTTYTVIANLGKCQATAKQLVKVAPYPQVKITTPDTAICFGDKIQLKSTYTATSFKWTPAGTLINANTLVPVAGPARTTTYTLIVSDTLHGCPKAVFDTIRIVVVPPITVDAGRDTSIVAEQPLQLRATATAASRFIWRPLLGLSEQGIYNPVVQLGADIDSVHYWVRAIGLQGCYGEDDILVRVFKTVPEIFIPSAFTPNGDGKNDFLKPLTVGISQLHYFRVFNRWGQLLYSTSEWGQGWDGTYNGVKQPSNTYVYIAEGTDYTGKLVFRKGTTVLIR